METDTKPIFDQLEKEPEKISDDNIQIQLSIYLHAQYVRTEATRNQLDNVITLISQQMKELGIKQENLHPNYRFKDGKHEQAKALLSLPMFLRYAISLIKNYNWSIGVNHTKYGFIISDNPAMQIGMLMNDLCFPISRTQCILMKTRSEEASVFTDAVIHGPVTILSEQDVVRHNLINCHNANRFIFGHRKDIENYLHLLNE